MNRIDRDAARAFWFGNGHEQEMTSRQWYRVLPEGPVCQVGAA